MPRETQQSIGEWAVGTFGNPDPLGPRQALRLLEEVVELCHAAGASGFAIEVAFIKSWAGLLGEKPGPAHPDKVAAEMGDVAIVLLQMAHRRGVDLQTAIDAKMAINRLRRWNLNGDGTAYHVKGGGEGRA